MCVTCSRLRRERVILECIYQLYNDGKQKIYMQETGSDFEYVRSFSKDAVGSEYISPEYKSGDVINGVLHEDANELSFDDESFDIVVSRDVFEHLSDPKKCLLEASRVLKDNGVCIITIPWDTGKDKSHQRANMENGIVQYIDEPKYHWNPVTLCSDSLVFWDYGWDFMDLMKDAGFKTVYVQAYYDRDKGYLGNIGNYFVGIK